MCDRTAVNCEARPGRRGSGLAPSGWTMPPVAPRGGGRRRGGRRQAPARAGASRYRRPPRPGSPGRSGPRPRPGRSRHLRALRPRRPGSRLSASIRKNRATSTNSRNRVMSTGSTAARPARLRASSTKRPFSRALIRSMCDRRRRAPPGPASRAPAKRPEPSGHQPRPIATDGPGRIVLGLPPEVRPVPSRSASRASKIGTSSGRARRRGGDARNRSTASSRIAR